MLKMMACCGGCLCCQCCCNEGETRTPEELTILGETREDEDEILPRKDYESLDYDRCINEPLLEVLEGLDKKKARRYEAIKWILVFAIGVSTGLTGLFVDFFVRLFTQLKFSLVGQSVEECSENGCLALSLLELLALNMVFVFISSVLVLIEPVAAGSGISEIKSYLNGVKIPGIVRLRTFICKVTGVLFAVAGGLFVGKEGPMIHSGAIVGAGLPQFQSITFKKIRFHFPYFRSDRDKRDFVSAGAAAGVAAAFGAPIGGTLFSLEEGSSFWNQALTWKVLFCSMSATFTLNFFRSGINFNKWGSFQLPGLLNFGEFKCVDGDKMCHLWTAVDLAFFVLMGVAGGLLGALFNCINKRLAKYRMRNVHPKARFIRLLESLLVCMVTTLVIFVASVTLGECRDLVSTNNNTSTQGSVNEEVNSTIRRFFCYNNTYNDMATLFFNPQEVAIHQLFHQNATFSPVTLLLFFVLYFFMSCWTYGVSVPSGLFVPSLLCGASLGRLVANVLKINFHMQIYSGTFALIGAAAFLGGVVRMTISLTVILIESTNEITYGLPIMITLMVAKWTGDFFNKGIYDIHIHLKGVPLLEWETEVEMDKHVPYPNLYPDQSPSEEWTLEERFRPLTFHGLILRSQLVNLLICGVCYAENQSSASQPRLSHSEMTEDYPRFPDIHDLDLALLNPRMIVDVTPYMNPCPYTVSPNTCLSQVFNLFRTMGLRHLPVVNAVGEIVGIITRHNLTHEFLVAKLRQHYITI
uniref:Chloride channel protein n=2 Tax=Sinocyclocheilus anshuiensis TaxID=1608454 RepID=A0A671KMX5_9TELE